MFFSFLVPVYNTEKYLKQCVDSLLVQTGAPFEIILLDDGSTDSCPQICDDYAAAYPGIVRVVHKENEGLLLTRRRGFREASGDWFICIDSDDYTAPNLLESVVKTIQSTSSCDMVMYNYQYVNHNGILFPSRLRLADGSVFEGTGKLTLYELRLTSTTINNMWLRAVHRSIVDISADYSQAGIRNMCEDTVQVLPLYTNAQKIVYIDKPLYYYRKGDESITSRVTLAHWQAINRSFVLEQPYVEHWDVSESVIRRRYTKQLENICSCVRWLYGNSDDIPSADIIRCLKKDALFSECLAHFEKKYASSRYTAISVPIISAAISQEHFHFLKFYFKVEHLLRK